MHGHAAVKNRTKGKAITDLVDPEVMLSSLMAPAGQSIYDPHMKPRREYTRFNHNAVKHIRSTEIEDRPSR